MEGVWGGSVVGEIDAGSLLPCEGCFEEAKDAGETTTDLDSVLPGLFCDDDGDDGDDDDDDDRGTSAATAATSAASAAAIVGLSLSPVGLLLSPLPLIVLAKLPEPPPSPPPPPPLPPLELLEPLEVLENRRLIDLDLLLTWSRLLVRFPPPPSPPPALAPRGEQDTEDLDEDRRLIDNALDDRVILARNFLLFPAAALPPPPPAQPLGADGRQEELSLPLSCWVNAAGGSESFVLVAATAVPLPPAVVDNDDAAGAATHEGAEVPDSGQTSSPPFPPLGTAAADPDDAERLSLPKQEDLAVVPAAAAATAVVVVVLVEVLLLSPPPPSV